MVRNLNFKVKNDFKDKDKKTTDTILHNNMGYLRQIEEMKNTIDDQKTQLEQ